MPTVVFKEDFFDGSRRYRAGQPHDIPDNIKLPKYDIQSIDGKPYTRPTRDYKPTPQPKSRRKPVEE
jgi:hypothetical protein